MSLKDDDVPEALYGVILSRIKARKIKTAKIKLAIFGSLSLFSLIAIIPAFKYVLNDFYQSGFYNYLSLIFSELERNYPFARRIRACPRDNNLFGHYSYIAFFT